MSAKPTVVANNLKRSYSIPAVSATDVISKVTVPVSNTAFLNTNVRSILSLATHSPVFCGRYNFPAKGCFTVLPSPALAASNSY